MQKVSIAYVIYNVPYAIINERKLYYTLKTSGCTILLLKKILCGFIVMKKGKDDEFVTP